MDVRAPGVGEKRSAKLDPELLEEDVELFAGGRGHAAAPVRPAAMARLGLLMDLQGLEVKSLDETEAGKVTFEDEEVAMEMTAVSGTKGDVPELFGGGYFVEVSKGTAPNLTPGTTYDLRTGLNLKETPRSEAVCAGRPGAAEAGDRRRFADVRRLQQGQAARATAGSMTAGGHSCTSTLMGHGAGSCPRCQPSCLSRRSSAMRGCEVTCDQRQFGLQAEGRFARKRTHTLGDECTMHRSAP